MRSYPFVEQMEKSLMAELRTDRQARLIYKGCLLKR